MIFKLADQIEKEEKILYWKAKIIDGELILSASTRLQGLAWYNILRITKDGYLRRFVDIPEMLGLPLNGEGKVKLSGEE